MDDIISYLEQAGWYEDRHIDIAYMIDDFRRQGYPEPNDLIKHLFQEFWNIRIERTTPEGLRFDLRFYTDEGLGCTDVEQMKLLEKVTGTHCFPVGSINDGHYTLLLSADAKFYMLADQGLFYLGDTIFDACSVVLFQQDLIKVAG